MLVGRAAELAELEGILADLRVAEGRALILLGEAGIGKTALLDALAERAGDNFTVLRARGVESEAEIAFSGLSDLLSPVIEDLDALPAPQSRAMAAALALESAQPGDRLAVCVATRGLLNASAQRRPILVLVDDLHWLDASSRECVFYAARRAAGPVAFALAARQDVGEAGGGSELPSLRLGRLEDESSLALLAQAAPDLAPPVASALVAAAVGNPLALVELPATLSPAQRKGIAALDLPLAPGDRLYGEFTRRIEGLPNRAPAGAVGGGRLSGRRSDHDLRRVPSRKD